MTERLAEDGKEVRLGGGKFCLSPLDPALGLGSRVVDFCKAR